MHERFAPKTQKLQRFPHISLIRNKDVCMIPQGNYKSIAIFSHIYQTSPSNCAFAGPSEHVSFYHEFSLAQACKWMSCSITSATFVMPHHRYLISTNLCVNTLDSLFLVSKACMWTGTLKLPVLSVIRSGTMNSEKSGGQFTFTIDQLVIHVTHWL